MISRILASTLDETMPTVGRLVACALWIGLVYGLVEGVGFSLLRLVPWSASPLSGTSPDILWVDPVAYAAVFGLVGLAVAVVFRNLRVIRPDVLLVFLLVWLASFLFIDLHDHHIANYASAALGCGVGVQAARWYRRRADRWLTSMVRTLPHLAGLVLVVAAIIIGTSRAREAMAMRRALPAASPHANVLLLVIDTQRADHFSGYGYARHTTPHLDRLSKEGVLFERAHSPSSWTLPSHASMMTGRWPNEHRAGDPFRPFLDGRYPTLAEALRDAGYATGAFVANVFWVGRQVRLNRGFNRYEDFLQTVGDVPFAPVLGRKFRWEVAPKWGWVDLPGRRRADFMNQRLLDWLDQVGNRPFFAFVNYMDVHGPYLAPPPFATMFTKSDARTKVTEIELAPTTVEAAARMKARMQESIDSYDGSLAYLDHEISNLLDVLEKRGVARDTLVIVTSDHGESFGEHGLVNHGNSLYLDQTHVPLIIRFPGRLPGGIRDGRPVSLTQLPATVLRLVGLSDDRFRGPPLMEQARVQQGDQQVLTEVARRRSVPHDWPSAQGWIKSLVTDRWHFILSEIGQIELYDLTSDQGELHNVAGAAEWAPLVTSFRASLQRMLDADRPLDEARAARDRPAR